MPAWSFIDLFPQFPSSPVLQLPGYPMARVTPHLETILKRFDTPDEVREFEKGRLEIVTIAGQTLGRATYHTPPT